MNHHRTPGAYQPAALALFADAANRLEQMRADGTLAQFHKLFEHVAMRGCVDDLDQKDAERMCDLLAQALRTRQIDPQAALSHDLSRRPGWRWQCRLTLPGHDPSRWAATGFADSESLATLRALNALAGMNPTR